MAVKLLDRVKNACRIRNMSENTERIYSSWVEQFVRFHKMRHPSEMGPKQVAEFLTHLAVKKNVAGSTQNQALNALVFMYKNVLSMNIGKIDGIVWAKKKQRIPQVYTREEIKDIFSHLHGRIKLIACLMYGCGMRINEAISLRVKDIDFKQNLITVHDGKGGKDRTVMLPKSIKPELMAHIEQRQAQHKRDLQDGLGATQLPNALHKKYPAAITDFAWQYVFAADGFSMDKKNGFKGRWHIYDSTVQRQLKMAKQKAKIFKHGTCHILRHSFATHLLEDGRSIREVQVLMGHNDVNTTMIYTHVMATNIPTIKSPIDS